MGNGNSRWELVVSDPSPEGLLNELAAQGIAFAQAVPLDGATLSLTVPYGAMPHVRRMVEQRGGTLHLCRPKGPRPVLGRLIRRYVLVGFLLVWAVLLGLSNLFVWRIEVVGAETVPTGVILRSLSEAGAGIGSFWPAFDSEALRNRLLLDVPQLRWAAVNYRSGAVEVIVRERRTAPSVIDNDAPVHIIARRSGVIAALSVKQGQSLVGVGDTVEKGDILISGAAQSTMGTVRGVHALGTVTARTWHTLTARQPAEETEKRYTGQKSWKISVIFGTNRVNFYSDSSISGSTCDKIIMEYHMRPLGVLTLPLRIAVEQQVYWTPLKRPLSPAVQEELAQGALTEALNRRLGDSGTVTDRAYAAAPRGEGMTVTLRAECLEEIGEERPMAPEELRQMNTLGDERVND